MLITGITGKASYNFFHFASWLYTWPLHKSQIKMCMGKRLVQSHCG